MADDKKEANASSPLESIVFSTLAGGLFGALNPGLGIVAKFVSTVAYSAVVGPLIDKIFHREASVKELYKNAPYEATGFFGGTYLSDLVRYVF
ncbi:MAG: hypothetical protein U9O94_11235 [Nanoarchaeota archaeon]|nr:hypothetical protein [Nanoarchaeota archaeon]